MSFNILASFPVFLFVCNPSKFSLLNILKYSLLQFNISKKFSFICILFSFSSHFNIFTPSKNVSSFALKSLSLIYILFNSPSFIKLITLSFSISKFLPDLLFLGRFFIFINKFSLLSLISLITFKYSNSESSQSSSSKFKLLFNSS